MSNILAKNCSGKPRGLINAFLHYITDGQLGTGITKIGNTGITILHVENKSWKVMEISRVDHLEETITD
ncbi:hypothetical protein ACLMAB_27910 [Brevibacillus laterosporus]